MALSDHAFSFIVLTVRNKVIICHIRDFIGFESVSAGSFICPEKISWLVLSGLEENAKVRAQEANNSAKIGSNNY